MSQDPVRVSPIIKLCRWSFLIGGFIYGVVRHSQLSKIENELREVQAREKVIRDAQLAKEKKLQAETEAKALAMLSKSK